MCNVLVKKLIDKRRPKLNDFFRFCIFMWDFIYGKLETIVTWQIFAVLSVLFIFCYLGFEWRRQTIGEQIIPFDTRYWYTPREAADLLNAMGERGRRIYAITQITLDFLFPFVYGGLLIIVFFAFYQNPKYLLLIPLLTVVADLLENITTAYLAWSFTEAGESQLAWLAAIFTLTKRIGLILALFVLWIGIGFLLKTRS
jgi:hypothetical protein